jgi:serine/threonine-protein kinase
MRRFEEEARTVGQLNHPNIVVVHDIGVHDGAPFIVTEMLEGEDLRQQLNRGPLPQRRAIDYAQQIARGLAATHARGIVHRDLKPENLLMTREGCVKILDFGLAKLTDATDAEPSVSTERLETSPGFIVGTIGYLAPEQLRGERADHRADVFAFGVIFHEMLSGRRPFERPSPSEVVAAILKDEPPDLDGATGLIALNRIVRRCLEKDPERRFQSARDLAFALDMLSPTSEAAFEADAALIPPRRGTGRVRRAEDDAPSTESASVSPIRSPAARRLRRWLLPAGVLLVVTAGVLRWFWPLSSAVPAERPIMRLDVDLGPDISIGSEPNSGLDRAVGISPDGERLVFVSSARLLTRRLDHSVAVPLAGTEGVASFFFAQDGRSVAFVQGNKLKRVPLDGGSVRTICDDLPPGIRGGSWGGDTIVLGTISGGLLRIPQDGGSAVPLTRLQPGEFTHRWPHVLPDGEAVLFTSHDYPSYFHAARIDLLSLSDGRRTRLLEGATFGRFVAGTNATGHVLFVRGGVLFAVAFDPARAALVGAPFPVLEDLASAVNFGSAQFDASAAGTLVYRRASQTLAWLDASGSTRFLPFEPGFYEAPNLSPDGNRLAFIFERALWIYDIERGTRTQVAKDPLGVPLWTSDGRLIVFSTQENIFWVPADGGAEPRPLLPPKSSVVRRQTSIRDGVKDSRLVFMELNVAGTNAWDLWTVPIRVGRGELHAFEPEPFLETSNDEREMALSSDGQWVAYSSRDRDTGVPDVYVRAFPGDGRRWKVSEGGGAFPQWSRDLPQLFFETARRIMVAPYSAAGRQFAAGKPRLWSTQLVDSSIATAYSIFPDGTRVVAVVPDLAAEQKSRHVVTLWTHAVDEFRRGDGPSTKDTGGR